MARDGCQCTYDMHLLCVYANPPTDGRKETNLLGQLSSHFKSTEPKLVLERLEIAEPETKMED